MTPPEIIHILVIDDGAGQTRLVQRTPARTGYYAVRYIFARLLRNPIYDDKATDVTLNEATRTPLTALLLGWKRSIG